MTDNSSGLSMVERMARAMFDMACAQGSRNPSWWNGERARFEAQALAALRELREPTELIYGALRSHTVPRTQGLGAAFTAAIDAEIAAWEAGR